MVMNIYIQREREREREREGGRPLNTSAERKSLVGEEKFSAPLQPPCSILLTLMKTMTNTMGFIF